ncbi:MAG: putative LPS assembly protein LptD, partial [Prevotella sp.]
NVYNWNLSVSASTKLYGFWVPNRKIFGDKIQTIRHVVTPTVSFSYAPDFSASRYGYYETYQRTNSDGSVDLVQYSPYQNGLYGVPGKGKTGSISFGLDNNIEMKVRSDKDSTGFKKLSLIDNLGLNMSYNMAAKEKPWSDLSMNIRLKWWKNYTFNMNAVFASYAYELDSNGKPYVGNHTYWGMGKFGRFQGMSQNISYTLNPEKIKKLFGGGDDTKKDDDKKKKNKDEEGIDTDIESNVDATMIDGQRKANKKKDTSKAATDDDGYMMFSMPWSLTFGYGITMRENTSGTFNTSSMRYPYKFTQTLNFSGNLRISDGWNISFSSGYDFENHDISMTTASLQRDLHCFNMSCSVVLAPYTSYNFTFRCNASTLTDALKYDKRSGYSNAVQWY